MKNYDAFLDWFGWILMLVMFFGWVYGVTEYCKHFPNAVAYGVKNQDGNAVSDGDGENDD